MDRSWPRATGEKNQVLHDSMRAAFEAGWRKGITDGEDVELERCLEEVDLWAFDARGSAEKKTAKKSSGGRAPKKGTPPKPDETNEQAKKEYDPQFCKARRWNAGDEGDLPIDAPGHGMQCWYPVEEDTDGFCRKCSEKMADDSKENWGVFSEPLSDSPGHKANGKPHPWAAMKKLKKEKEPKKSPKKEKKKPKKEKKEKEKKQKKEKKEKVEPEVADENADAENGDTGPVLPEENNEVDGQEKNDEEQQKNDEEGAASDADTEELEEDSGPQYKEYVYKGFPLKWNLETNELLDMQDEEKMGMMEKGEDGEWVPKMNEPESGEEDSDSDSDSE